MLAVRGCVMSLPNVPCSHCLGEPTQSTSVKFDVDKEEEWTHMKNVVDQSHLPRV